jgi:hypothetical protein
MRCWFAGTTHKSITGRLGGTALQLHAKKRRRNKEKREKSLLKCKNQAHGFF